MSETHSAEFDALVPIVRAAVVDWNSRTVEFGDDVSAWITKALVDAGVRVNPPEATPTTNAARPEGDDSSAREGITAR